MFENDILLAISDYKLSSKRLLLEESRNNRRYNRKNNKIK